MRHPYKSCPKCGAGIWSVRYDRGIREMSSMDIVQEVDCGERLVHQCDRCGFEVEGPTDAGLPFVSEGGTA